MKYLLISLLGLGVLQAEPVSLFDGKTLAGWQVHPGEERFWKVQDGAITGGSLEEKVPGNTFLASAKSYENFDLTYKLRLVKGEGFQNSGMQIRSVRDKSHMKGYQVDGGIGYWGDLYDEGRRAKLGGPLDPAALKAVAKDWDWNEYRVLCEGTRIRVWINGVAVTDYTEKDKTIPADGVFGLQAHSGGKFLVQIKDVMINELPPTPDSAKWAAPKVEVKPEPIKAQAPAGTLSPEEQIKGFKLPEGYTVELVSSEKEGTEKPITVAWDRHGKMWTMTATEYPLDANESPDAAAALYASGGKDRILVFDDPNSNKVQTPRVFAEGLAIPLGILPMMDGVLAQYGTQIRRYIDDDKDGKADRFEVVLEGFGVQDSHLFAHQFERIPGGWIHVAQGAFNASEVRRPGGVKFADGLMSVTFKNCKLGRFKPDGSLFEPLTAGPNNIWGLVISRTGETYIQEANDMGYPVAEFVPGSNYPTPFGPRLREDAPLQPPSLKDGMGGTGLSGLALAEDEGSPFAKDFPGSQVFYIPNPITSKIQMVTMTRDAKGHPVYKKGHDFMVTDDKSFRPIAAHFGPDGCMYVVDWYNKIISHNEVARAHPDRDKTSGRIWRIRHKDQTVPARIDLAKLEGQKLLDQLGGPNARTAAMAWNEIVDRKETKLVPDLKKILSDSKASDAKRLGALWALEGLKAVTPDLLVSLSKSPQSSFRYEAARIAGEWSLPEQDFLRVMEALKDDPHFRVRAGVINAVRFHQAATPAIVAIAAGYAKAPLQGKDRDGYDREFERYLARWAMSSHPEQTDKMMTEMKLPDEAAALAARSFEGEAAAVMLVKNLEKMQRAPTAQELGILAKYIQQPMVQEGLKKLLGAKEQRPALLNSLLQVDASVAAIPDFAAAVGDACEALLKESRNPENERLVVDLVRRFRISKLGEEVREWAFSPSRKPEELAIGLATLREIKFLKAADYEKLLDHADDKVRREAVTGFASMPGPEVIELFSKRWATLPGALKSIARDGMTSNKIQAEAFTKALGEGKFGQVDGSSVEKVSAVLGYDHPAVTALLKSQEGLLKSVIRFTGNPQDRILTNVTLGGAFTVETWIKLNEGISQADGLLARKGGADFNFYAEKLRVYGGPALGDVIESKRTIKAGEWIHCAITRDAEGRFTIYLDGDLDATGSKTSTEAFTGLNVGETTDKNGSAALYDEFRIWDVARTAEQIRMDFRTDYSDAELPKNLVLRITGKELSKAKVEGKVSATPVSDFPTLLTTKQRDLNQAKFHRFEELAKKTGDAEKGRALAEATCFICHQVKGKGLAIGPDLSGAGAMGVESLLRNILHPNEQLESGYYRHDVRLTNDSVVSGFLSGETADSIKIRRIGADELVIPKKDILAHDVSKRSLMPEGLIDGFTDQQVSDLFSYLNQLK
ncbi:MAG: family 16 glycoside hydrolase [Verrucomicrobiota bacterium]